jgi:hypothetical protein
MPTFNTHPLLNGFSGTIGDLVFYKLRNKEVMRRRAQPPTEWSEAQVARRSRFKLAAVYGKAVQKSAQQSAIYQSAAKARGCAPYHVALKDFLHPPEVQKIDLSGFGVAPGSRVVVEAVDDFEVSEVQVTIRTPEGAVLEEGAATRDAASGNWIYLSQKQLEAGQSVAVEATATDRPGHTGSLRVFWVFNHSDAGTQRMG